MDFFDEMFSSATQYKEYHVIHFLSGIIIEEWFDHSAINYMIRAINEDNIEVVDFLLRHNKYSGEILLHAVALSNIRIARLFLVHNIDIHYNNEAALQEAVDKRDKDIFNLLLEHGANISKLNPIEETTDEFDIYVQELINPESELEELRLKVEQLTFELDELRTIVLGRKINIRQSL